ncbi:MAG TPA: membrane protein insertase YidC [Streptosporangiaceae bacterium]|nr:membrane protein insertase YidC [Streptosporangiaceae bacterium]
MLGFLDAGVSVAYYVVTALVQFLTPVAGPLAAVAAIVVFTIAIRLALVPLSYFAMRGQAAQARLQPQVQDLRRRYARQPDKLQRELAELYRREGRGLLTGCLPLLAQLPFFSIMYRLFLSPQVGGHANDLLAHHLLGAPLGLHWTAAVLSTQGLVFIGLFALLAGVGWASARLARRLGQPGLAAPLPARPAGPAAPASAGPAAAAERLAARLARVLPYITVVVAMFVPLAAGLYLLTTTSWTVAERAILGRRIHREISSNEVTPARPPRQAARRSAGGPASAGRRIPPGRRAGHCSSGQPTNLNSGNTAAGKSSA